MSSSHEFRKQDIAALWGCSSSGRRRSGRRRRGSIRSNDRIKDGSRGIRETRSTTHDRPARRRQSWTPSSSALPEDAALRNGLPAAPDGVTSTRFRVVSVAHARLCLYLSDAFMGHVCFWLIRFGSSRHETSITLLLLLIARQIISVCCSRLARRYIPAPVLPLTFTHLSKYVNGKRKHHKSVDHPQSSVAPVCPCDDGGTVSIRDEPIAFEQVRFQNVYSSGLVRAAVILLL